MSWLKKLKKSRKTSQHPTSLGIPSHVGFTPPGIGEGPDPGIVSEDADNGGDSRIVPPDNTWDRQPHSSGASTSTPGSTDGVPHYIGESPQDPALSGKTKDVEGNWKGTTIDNPVIAADEEATRGFGPLKTVLSSVCADYQGTVVGNKIEDLHSRIVLLEKRFDSRPNDVAELRLRSKVIQKLEGIKGKFQSLSEAQRLKRPTVDSRVDQDISALLENAREIVFDYQMEHEKKKHAEERKLINQVEATVLNNFRCAQGAEFRHGGRNGCLKGTREAVLDKIELWTRDFYKPPVYWLNGLAGTGKTTVAQTIAERTFADGHLGASFFCSRDFEDRSNLHLIFPTLAVQLARKYTEFRSLFVPLVQSDPGIAHESLYDQMHKLIVQPLKESDISTTIIIDALDECKDEEPASAILSVLGQFVSEIPNVKFLLTGRPEPRIREGFRLPMLAEATDVFVLHEVEPRQVDSDIELFFKHKLSELGRRRRDLDDWPTMEQLELLCKRAAGLFVYAAATVKFIVKQSASPRKQLDLLLQSPENSTREGKMKVKADTTLDSLYTLILQAAFGAEDDPDNDPKVRSVLSAMILAANPLSPSTIAALLSFDVDEVFPLLSSVQSLLVFQEDIDCPVQPFHKSFPDFITDPDRCTNKRFHISPPNHHPRLLIGCLHLMDRTLEKNMCRLPEAVANSDVDDLKQRVEQYVGPALQYACRSWHAHLVDRHTPSVNLCEITSALHPFLERKFLFWLEVLSVLGAVRNAIDALQSAMGLLEAQPTIDLANDCHRFVAGYFEIIRASSPHIYHSALVLTPKTSIIRKLYASHSQPFARIVRGVKESWDSNTAVTTLPSSTGAAVWSPCNRLIAISSSDSIRVDILDSVTLQRLQLLGSPWERLSLSRVLMFSPDSRKLTYTGFSASHPDPHAPYIQVGREVFVVTWDLQTGGVVSAIERGGPFDKNSEVPHITYSADGNMVAILFRLETSGAIISVFDVVSGIYMHDVDCHQLDNLHLYHIWTHGYSIQFATAEPTRITIWEVGFTLGAATMKVKTLPGPDNIDNAICFGFHPTLFRAVFISLGTILVWDAQDSKPLLDHTNNDPDPSIAFSSDGCFFTCSNAGSKTNLWKESPTGYMLHGQLSSCNRYIRPFLSPNGKSIIAVGGSMVQLWHTNSFTPTPSDTSIQPHHTGGKFILDFFPNKLLAVVVRQGGSIVKVLDLKSGIVQLTIETSMGVYGLKMVKNTVVAIGCEKAITWNLPEGDSLPCVKLSIKDSTQITHLSDLPRLTEFDRVTAASMSPNSCYIALVKVDGGDYSRNMCLYSASTGQYLDHITSVKAGVPWFSPSGDNIWYVLSGKVAEVWTISRDKLDNRQVVDIGHESWGLPWQSSCGYQVTNDGWILGPNGKRLMMLPPQWQSKVEFQTWNGQFLALLHDTLTEPIIIEFEPSPVSC